MSSIIFSRVSADPQPSKDLLNRLLDRALHARPLAEAKAARAARPCQRCTIRSGGTLLAALLSAVLATLCKETGATLVGVFFVYELLVQLRCHRSKHQVGTPRSESGPKRLCGGSAQWRAP